MSKNRRRNALVVPGADEFMNKFKNEIAAELGISDYDNLDKGALPARVHGLIGGSMTKKLIALGQQAVMNGQNLSVDADIDYNEYKQQAYNEITADIEKANQIVQSLNQQGQEQEMQLH